MNLHKVQLTAPLGLAAAAANGPIYTSFDSGASWISNDVPAQQWFAIASSADGTRLAAAAGGESAGPSYVSFNAGKAWKPGSAIEGHLTWGAACSDGGKWAAAEGGEQPGLSYTREWPP